MGFVVPSAVAIVVDRHFQPGHFALRDHSQWRGAVDGAHVERSRRVVFHGHFRFVVLHSQLFLQHGFCRFVVVFPDLDINTVTILEVSFHVVTDGTQAKGTFLCT